MNWPENNALSYENVTQAYAKSENATHVLRALIQLLA
jgi:hypothetical protein